MSSLRPIIINRPAGQDTDGNTQRYPIGDNPVQFFFHEVQALIGSVKTQLTFLYSIGKCDMDSPQSKIMTDIGWSIKKCSIKVKEKCPENEDDLT